VLPGVRIAGQLRDLAGKATGGEVRQGHVLQHRTQVRPHRDPHLEELKRDLLRLGQPLALDGLSVGGRGELEGGADGVVGLGGDPHVLSFGAA
jgi:hypothetical protein